MVSETTKSLVAQQKSQMQTKITANEKQIEEYTSLISRMEEENTRLQSNIDALTTDVPEPTPVKEL